MIYSDTTYEKNVYVQRVDAETRADHITDVSYDVFLALPRGETYWGRVGVTLTIKKLPSKNLFLDFRGVSIGKLTINGEESKDEQPFRDHKVYLATNLLKEGENKVEIYIHNKYRKDGTGLHTFTDAQDGEQYLYTQFEADYCHFVFPCFDQPDLKATWVFTTLAPQDWIIVSNEDAEDQAIFGQDEALKQMSDIATLFKDDTNKLTNSKTFQFKQSPKISPYIYAICGGPYGFHQKNDEGFPNMRIYARKSLLESVNHQEMFMVTQAGIKFYKDFFGKEYPFNKYDQIFVPEHNFGAMENVGCVTYNESYLFRGEIPSLAKRLRFSITNLHELAHMWFGNLVTMKWWNDLWLNESFATFMSFVAMEGSPELSYFDTLWVSFLTYKFWGINEDQLSTTHPITCVINRTDEAESLFDGISYGKGSSFLKQLYNMIGRDVMITGLHNYFSLYSWGNTTLPDFVGSLNVAYVAKGDKSLGQDFNFIEWCDSWLTSSGVNILEPIVEYKEDGSIASFKVKQSCDLRGKNILRKQKIDIALYDSEFTQHIIKDVIISDKDEINNIQVDFQQPVSAILINVNDHGYAKVRFDKKSLDAFTNNLHRVKDILSRASIWRQFWLLVMDRQMTSLQYFEFVSKQLPYEKVDQTIQVALMNLRSLIEYYVPEDQVFDKIKVMFQTLLDLLSREDIEESTKGPIVDNIFGFILDKDHLSLAIQWLDTGFIFKSSEDKKSLFELQKKHKFSILKVLHRSLDVPQAQKAELLEKVIGDDKSDIAQNTRETCHASLPDPAVKAEIWRQLTDENSTESLYTRGAKIAGFYSWQQKDLVAPYFDKYYEVLPTLYAKQPHKFLENFFYSLLPRMEVKDEHIVKLVSLKLKTPDTHTNFINLLNEGIELLIRTKEIRALNQQQ